MRIIITHIIHNLLSTSFSEFPSAFWDACKYIIKMILEKKNGEKKVNPFVTVSLSQKICCFIDENLFLFEGPGKARAAKICVGIYSGRKMLKNEYFFKKN